LVGTPALFQAKEISSTNQQYGYEVEIPKKAFELYEGTDKEQIQIEIDGLYVKNGRVVLPSSSGFSGMLTRK
jgi:hypothetical protein